MIISTKKITLALLLAAFAQFAMAQVKVGENPTTINKGSILELESTNKGLLFPRVSLTNTTTWSLASSSIPVAGMMVYNIKTTALGFTGTTAYPVITGDGTGVYYWDGTGWVAAKGTSGNGISTTVNNNDGTYTFNYTNGTSFTTGSLKGDKGDAGAVGATGSEGKSVLGGTGAPGAGTGKDGDTYVDTATGITYVNTGGTWAADGGSLKGPQGAAGTNGADGDTGPQGIQGVTGAQGGIGLIANGTNTTVTGTGVVGDEYKINTAALPVTTSDNGLTKTLNNIQLGGALIIPTTITADVTNTLAVAGLQTGVATDKLVVSDPTTGVLKAVDQSSLNIEPWQVQTTTDKATTNAQNIYQMGSVAIGKNQVQTGVALDVVGAVRGGKGSLGIVGVNSVAFGSTNEASGLGSAAFGVNYVDANAINNKASGINSVSFGSRNIVAGKNSATFGVDNNVQGDFSVSFGNTHIIEGYSSVAFGTTNKIFSDYVAVFGSTNTASGEGSIIFGQENNSIGFGTMISGVWNTAATPWETVIGFGNAITTTSFPPESQSIASSDDPLFQVGNGANNTTQRNNALTILRDGKVGIGITGAEAAAKPKETFDVGSGGVKIRAINTGPYTGNAATDKIVVADADGVLKTISAVGTSAIKTVTVNYIALAADETILVDASAAAVMVDLPATSIVGKKYTVKKIDATPNTVSVSGGAGHSIDGNATIFEILPYQGWVMQFDGTNWFIIGKI
jgi:hypothetical protein